MLCQVFDKPGEKKEIYEEKLRKSGKTTFKKSWWCTVLHNKKGYTLWPAPWNAGSRDFVELDIMQRPVISQDKVQLQNNESNKGHETSPQLNKLK